MLKKTSIAGVLLASILSLSVSAQDGESSPSFFKADKCFTGGTVSLSFGNNFTVMGLNPHLGYSILPFVDVALSVNFNYTSQRDILVQRDRVRQIVFAPGAFLRVFPLKSVFAQAQYEQSFIRNKYISPIVPTEIVKYQARSFLVGGGYAGGREPGQLFYYICVLWDVYGDPLSPYIDNAGRSIPIYKGGLNIPLFTGRFRKRF